MKNINEHFKFLNGNELENINLEDQEIDLELKNLFYMIFPNLVSFAKHLSLHESIYHYDKKTYKRFFKNKEILNTVYTYKIFNKRSFPLYNKDYLKHSLKSILKMSYFTLLKNLPNNHNIDINESRLCFYKPNALSLVANKWKFYEKLKINNYNNFEYLFENSKFEINNELYELIILKFSDFFKDDFYFNIFKRISYKFVKIIYFVDFIASNYLEYPKAEKIIFGSESQLLTKIIRHKLISKDYKVYTYEHGCRSFLFKNDFFFTKYNRLFFSTNYFITGIGQKIISSKDKEIKNKIILSKSYEPKIKNILNKSQRFKNNKKILYILEMNNNNFVHEPHNISFKFQENIIKYLINFFNINNLFFKLKKHPDSTINSFSEFIINGDLIDLYNEFDIILFDHTLSTAFCEALNSNKKIIILDFNQNNFEDNFSLIVNKRCHRISTTINNDLSIDLDEEFFKECIFKNNKIDEEIIHNTKNFFRPEI